MKRILFIAFILLINCPGLGQHYYEEFKKVLTAKDSTAQRQLLERWAKTNSDDPELYTCYFNYYIQRSLREVIRLGDDPQEGKSLQIMDSTNQVVGYIFAETAYDAAYLQRAFQIIDTGIARFPNRLDMRFGKTHVLGKAGEYDAFAVEIVKFVSYSAVNKNRWQWTLSAPVNDPKNFLLDNVQTYVNTLFNAGVEQAKNIRRVAEAVLKHYPGHVVSLSNLGVSYIFEQDYRKALEPLLKAEKKSRKDAIIHANIAYVYVNMNNNRKAVEYYEKARKYGDDDLRQFAEGEIERLKQ